MKLPSPIVHFLNNWKSQGVILGVRTNSIYVMDTLTIMFPLSIVNFMSVKTAQEFSLRILDEDLHGEAHLLLLNLCNCFTKRGSQI